MRTRGSSGQERYWGWCIAALLAFSCTKGAPKVEEPVKPSKPADSVSKPTPVPAPPPPLPADTCRVVTKLAGEPPFFVAGQGIVVTRIMKPCVTRDGARGYEEDTPYLTMGFPCTGGAGRIDIKGNNYTAPRMVSFILGTDCGMSPSSTAVVDKLVREALDLPPLARLMAVTPFVVQYWEIPGMSDTDTGFTVELRSAPALEGLWKKLRENQPVQVRLYGRENAWVQGGHFYLVDAELKITGRHAFQVSVLGVKSLTQTELEELKGRCEALRPKRNCADVF